MKNLLFIPLTVLLIVFGSSCETDFDLEGDWQEIPVMYGYLSVQDTAYYVRLEKAFLEPGGNAEQIAENPDSLYYPDGDVVLTLERLSSGQSVVMERVDGNLEGYVRQEGPFATSPNILYKVPRSAIQLNGGDGFRLQLKRSEDVLATVESVMLNELENSYFSTDWNTSNYNRLTDIRYRPGGPAARVFDIDIVFNYEETDPNNPGTRIPKTLTWDIASGVERNEELSVQIYQFANEEFYQFIGSSLDPLPNGTRRFIDAVAFVSAGGVEVEEYLDISNANIGITSSQALPVYSNVEGGIGIVSSRYILESPPFNLNGDSRDSLYFGQYTRDLNFVP